MVIFSYQLVSKCYSLVSILPCLLSYLHNGGRTLPLLPYAPLPQTLGTTMPNLLSPHVLNDRHTGARLFLPRVRVSQLVVGVRLFQRAQNREPVLLPFQLPQLVGVVQQLSPFRKRSTGKNLY